MLGIERLRMPQLRYNAATREWVIIATDRARRPEDFKATETGFTHEREPYRTSCPFCPGQEAGNPSLWEVRNDAGEWQLRVILNKYPAMRLEGEVEVHGDVFERSMPGVGQHEVVIEDRLHNTTLALMPTAGVRRVLQAWLTRYRFHMERPDTHHVMLYKNHGPTAGMSLEHSHSQLLSLPVCPWQVRHRMLEAENYHRENGQCVYCEMRAAEVEKGHRLVYRNEHFTAFVPYACYSPFLMWIVPQRHMTTYGEISNEELDALASILREVLARLYEGLDDPAFNMVLRVPGREYYGAPYAHWYVSIVPRLGKLAGFELGTGMFINSSVPEDNARFLRELTVNVQQ